jgi:hypothetical protein
MSEPIKITHLESEDQTTTNTDDVITVKQLREMAIKQKDCWKVFLNDGRELQKCEMELVNTSSFFIDYAFENVMDEQKQ